MSNFAIILTVSLLGLINLVGTTDYCDPELCTFNNTVKHHIGCNNNGEFSSNCDMPFEILLTSELRHAILHIHNDLRNKVANGTLPGFQTAQKMAFVTWSRELEYLAALNVIRCKLEYDECHNTRAYRNSGQNIAIWHQSLPIQSTEYESIIFTFINQWFDEYRYANQTDIDKYSESDRENEIRHFTLLIQDRMSKVGCSILQFFVEIESLKKDTILMVCNYSFDNFIDSPVYVAGLMCSGCRRGRNREFNGLCSKYEKILPIRTVDEINNTFSRSSLSRPIPKSDPPIPLDTISQNIVIVSPDSDWEKPQSEVSERSTLDSDQSGRLHPTSRPTTQTSRFRNLIQPLLPIPQPIIMLGEVLQSVAAFFIIP